MLEFRAILCETEDLALSPESFFEAQHNSSLVTLLTHLSQAPSGLESEAGPSGAGLHKVSYSSVTGLDK